MVQGFRLCAPNAGGLGSIPGQGTRSHKLQLRSGATQLKKKKKAWRIRLMLSDYLKGQCNGIVMGWISVEEDLDFSLGSPPFHQHELG